MKTTVHNGECVIEHSNGKTERCESLREMQEVCHQSLEYLKVLRPRRTEKRINAPVPAGTLCRHGDLSANKKVRITMNPNLEKI